MNLSAQESLKLAEIASKHSTNMQAAILAAYEEGILEGALRISRKLATDALNSTPASGSGDGDSEDTHLTASDIATLKRMGIDHTKRMRERNSVFTIVGYKPSRWKFPISVQTQNGARYKMTVDQVKRMQGA